MRALLLPSREREDPAHGVRTMLMGMADFCPKKVTSDTRYCLLHFFALLQPLHTQEESIHSSAQVVSDSVDQRWVMVVDLYRIVAARPPEHEHKSLRQRIALLVP